MGELHPENLKPFKKGDPRINRKGRPKSFDALRKLAQLIGNEDTDDGKTVVEKILRTWSKSPNPQFQKTFIEIAYGKVPDSVSLTDPDGKGIIKIIEVEIPTADNDK